jgi:hypothetical protein
MMMIIITTTIIIIIHGVDSRQEQDFSLLHTVQTGSGAHPASYPMGTGGVFSWGKAAGRRS